MENILLPSKMTFTPGSHEHEEILTIEPLHHGYGTTIGNALRRVMLSSLEGAAVTGVKIKGVQHEFSTIEGVKEDVLEIVLNLKQLRLKLHSDQPVTLSLTVDGREGIVTAADIEKNADVEIANPDLIIATISSKTIKLHMDIVVDHGRGFVPTEERDNSTNDIGMIAIDSVFSPVHTVGMKIENTRVGEITNYDKVIMNIITDGTITAQEAVEQATKVILSHFNWLENQFKNSSLLSGSSETESKEDEVVEEEVSEE
ncbi:MAG: DNA-directed RNA polymerase subunit alpha [uncultured bacterium]|uniref:DNA-directed RNA polymerase subunit alpha n=1 Tax=Candidatus Uhrbacteria bacterium GW2011_GWC1_41_20 TaxID=1618983 RepID=A0A0G0VBN6_9BACT|nr:MAG: DNA-directed RNA polymerase subunit alpha [uncultured bacterium]KKR22335.1 MAG: DNA-directed RNA polymerase subunit alpha [Candidatus Uhrbacteria bacterium GW2011_GWE1_39_46]KKR63549.1 MAG: DNA-directed RNA polymerase subunit alpha [Candidatus Uhrbacteria bacterium GW2011_GWC2_40_450]KKR89713.1 MAG: DNA-directed RNA polymerase subunit alpha [Candidatus Uhrbacteria bacterium GW2011_GWE2_41_1153]KKR89743.1 MAG: DNA-directed RNA polymerase subunit alpha [Candidatus Uhrbacteria bacterium GW